jgi:hypothetical protein
MGAGPGTGRGLGYCGGYDAPGFANPVFGRGIGWRRGWGGGFGWRHRFSEMGPAAWEFPHYAASTKEETLQALKAQANWLNEQLEAIHKRIEELEK